MSIARKEKRSATEICKAVRKQKQYVKRDLRYVDSMLQQGKLLARKFVIQLQTIRKLYDQPLNPSKVLLRIFLDYVAVCLCLIFPQN